jgi:hypothetical protein
MARGFRLLLAIVAAVAACSGEARAAASDQHGKTAVAPPAAKKGDGVHAGDKVEVGHAPKHPAGVAPAGAKKVAPADAHPVKHAMPPDAPAPKKAPAADTHPLKNGTAAAHAGKPLTTTDASKNAAHPPPPHAPVKAAKVEAPADAAAAASAVAGGEPLPVATDLHALNERIQERLSEVRKSQASQPARAKSPASRREASSAATAPTRAARIELSWRPSVTWPAELVTGVPAPPASLPVERVSVAWGPQP